MKADVTPPTFRHNRPLQGMVAWLLLLWVAAAIEPRYPRDWPLENVLVFAYAALLVLTCRRFAFGLLLAVPFRELLLRAVGLKPSWAGFAVVTCVLGFSGSCEDLEAVTAMIVSPELGAAYLATQGDAWDGTKDMMMAMAGALLAMGVVEATRRRSRG